MPHGATDAATDAGAAQSAAVGGDAPAEVDDGQSAPLTAASASQPYATYEFPAAGQQHRVRSNDQSALPIPAGTDAEHEELDLYSRVAASTAARNLSHIRSPPTNVDGEPPTPTPASDFGALSPGNNAFRTPPGASPPSRAAAGSRASRVSSNGGGGLSPSPRTKAQEQVCVRLHDNVS